MPPEDAALFICPNCPRRDFKDKTDYQRHRNQHEKPYRCRLCGHTFALKTGLDRHRQSHLGKTHRPVFKCKFPLCKFGRFNRVDNLRLHMKKKHQYEIKQRPSGKTLQEYLESFTKKEMTPQHDRDFQLLEAATEGNEEEVLLLISQGANESMINERGQTALHLAADMDHLHIVALLRRNADAASSVFQGAVYQGRLELVKVLIENGVNIDNLMLLYGRRRTALFRAVRNQDTEMVNLLLEHGADFRIRQPDDENQNVLHLAARTSSEMTRCILRANPSREDLDTEVDVRRWYMPPTQLTALSFAIGQIFIFNRDFNEVTTLLLLEAGATVNENQWDRMPQWFRVRHAIYDPSQQSNPG